SSERQQIERLLAALRLDPKEVAVAQGPRAKDVAAVERILADVANRGDDAIVESSRKFDDPNFTAGGVPRGGAGEEKEGGGVSGEVMAALQRSIAQVREYQAHIMPKPPAALMRPGVELGLRFTPLDSAGLYFPGGKASYPSSLIMLAVPAQVAGVKQIVVCT